MDPHGHLDFNAVTRSLRSIAQALYADIDTPAVALVKQRIQTPRLDSIDRAVSEGVARIVASTGRRGEIAVGVGSRGIANITQITIAAIRELKKAGFQPFVVPAMGSHGSTLAEGQAKILDGYGINERTVGVPVKATMDTEVIGEVDGVPVHMDKNAVGAGAVFLIARIKPHTDFVGPIESGLAKMCAIGLAKQRGAQAIHAAGIRGLRDIMPKAARLAAAKGLLLGGLGIVENARDETARIDGLLANEVGGDGEAGLLAQAKQLLPKIPFDEIDVLVIDSMGKDISGSGMDANVIGRWRIPGVDEDMKPKITCIATLSLTEASHGNAAGLGLADFIPVRLAEQVDLGAFYLNLLTAGIAGVERGQFPIVLATDLDCVKAAIACCGRTSRQDLRLVWIADTLHTETLAVSADLVAEVRQRDGLELLSEPEAMPFDGNGRLRPIAA